MFEGIRTHSYLGTSSAAKKRLISNENPACHQKNPPVPSTATTSRSMMSGVYERCFGLGMVVIAPGAPDGGLAGGGGGTGFGAAEETVSSGDTVTFTASSSALALLRVRWSAADGDPASGSGRTFETVFTHEGLPEFKTFSVDMRHPRRLEEVASCDVSVRCKAPECEDVPAGCTREDANACECGEIVCEEYMGGDDLRAGDLVGGSGGKSEIDR